MQRHWHDNVGAVEQLHAVAAHPAAERLCDMRAVAVLQREHQMPAVLVVAHDGARPVPARLLPGAIGAHRLLAHRVRKGQAADGAPGRCKERHAGPARAAQRVGLVDNRAASETARRQDAIDDGAAEPAQLWSKNLRNLHASAQPL
jgi:hypothetical protein